MQRLRYPLIIAHRGCSLRYPENTLIAFEKALESKVQMIELDVTLTRDRELVVIHDETLDRTTNGRGRVMDHTLAELKRLDAGGWFSRRFTGEPVPTLADVLKMAVGRAAVNIEIKPEAYDTRHPEDAVERQVWELLHRQHMTDDVVVSSFDARVLTEISRMERPPALGYLTEGAGLGGVFDVCQRIGAFSWNVDYRYVNRTRIDQAHAMGLRVFTYTVNSRKQILSLLDMGVDGIFTDDPVAAAACLSNSGSEERRV